MTPTERPASIPNPLPQDDTSNNEATTIPVETNEVDIEDLRINQQKIIDYIIEMRKTMAKKWLFYLTQDPKNQLSIQHAKHQNTA